jgi:hypothetical protein
VRYISPEDLLDTVESELDKEFNRDIKLVEVKKVWQQENDCCDDGDHDHNIGLQYLTVETHDGGGGPYLVIKTERWAIDVNNLDAFVEQLRSVVEGVNADD